MGRFVYLCCVSKMSMCVCLCVRESVLEKANCELAWLKGVSIFCKESITKMTHEFYASQFICSLLICRSYPAFLQPATINHKRKSK